MPAKPRVVVLGGGFAGLESAFYLRHKLADRVDITLVSDRNYFTFRPNTIYIPFGEDPEKFQVDLAEPARLKHIDFIRARAERIDPVHRLVHVAHMEIAYDYLVVATGAALRPAEIPGLGEHAVTLWSPDDMLKVRAAYQKLVGDARDGKKRKLLFLVPPNNRCPGPLYEMAMMTDTWLREQGVRDSIEITWTTFEDTYVQAYGPRLDPTVAAEFDERCIFGYTRQIIDRIEPGRAMYQSGGSLPFDVLVSLPPFVASQTFDALPVDDRGFLKVDPDSRRVEGQDRIFAAGDATDFPMKQAYLALLQADAAADHIAAEILGEKPKIDFHPMNVYVMEGFDKATFAQAPLRYTDDPKRPVTVDLEDSDHYKVGVSPAWRWGKRAMGAYIPWRFGHGEPFSAGLAGEAVEWGRKMMTKVMST